MRVCVRRYGYNTIVTMSQRNNSKPVALQAYHCMLDRNDEIDVFTYTSLLDVIGRNGHFDDALVIYETMRKGKNQPNVVTYITLIRVLSGWHCDGKITKDVSRAKETIVRLLREAEELVDHSLTESESAPLPPCTSITTTEHVSPPQSSTTEGSTPQVFISGKDGKLEVSVYNAALAGFVKMRDFEYFVRVLQMIHDKRIALTGTSLDIICKFFYMHFHLVNSEKFSGINSYGEYLVASDAISAETADMLKGNLNSYLERKQLTQSGNTVSNSQVAYTLRTSCLGRNATTSMRESVIAHDTDKLLERLSPSDCSQLHESDFITLLHQCRKRKWSDQIGPVLQCMREVSTEGVPARDIPPQPSLAPSLLTYEAALAGYFCVGAIDEAWSLFLEILTLSEVWISVSFDSDIDAEDDTYASNAMHFFRGVMKGFLRCGAASHASRAFKHMQEMNVSPTYSLVKCLLRGFGCQPELGVQLLEQLLESTDASFLHSYALTSVEGYTNPKLSEHLGDHDLISKGNKELLCTLLESVAVLGRPDLIESVIHMCSTSSCAVLTLLMSGMLCLPDVQFVMTLLMAACSSNSIPEACEYIHQWQVQGFLPRMAMLYSLALEALAGSVGGTSQRSVCDQMPSLPFRGFLRVRWTGMIGLDYNVCFDFSLYSLTYYSTGGSCKEAA